MSNPDRQLHLDRERGIFGGVCAGLGDYLGINPLFIRIGFVVATFTWLPTLLVYAILYFGLNDRPHSFSEVRRNLANNRVTRHLRDVNYRKGLYKNRRDGKLAGVCAGIADYLEINALFVRLAFVLSLFLGPLAILVYIVAAFLMDEEPPHIREQRLWGGGGPGGGPRSGYNQVRPGDISACGEKFSRLERKLERLEATITSKKFKLHSEFKRMG